MIAVNRCNSQTRIHVLPSRFHFGQEKGKVEAICLKFDHRQDYRFTYGDFSRLPNLRFLHVDSLNLHDVLENFRAQCRLALHNLPSKAVQRSGLLPKLQWLSWHNYPPKFDITKFSLANLAILDLSWSKLTDSWDGWSHIEVCYMLGTICSSLSSFYVCSRNLSWHDPFITDGEEFKSAESDWLHTLEENS